MHKSIGLYELNEERISIKNDNIVFVRNRYVPTEVI
jgi:hypothetical protein